MATIYHPNSLYLKYKGMAKQVSDLTDRTTAMLLFINEYCLRTHFFQPIWTSFIRPPKKPLSVHHFGRGLDMSKRVIRLDGPVSGGFATIYEIDDILLAVNKAFPYGKGKIKSAIFHKVKGSSEHFHFQSAK